MNKRQEATEITDPLAERDLVARIAGGEVAVVRGGLQPTGLLDEFIRISLDQVAAMFGEEAARAVEARGFERIHEIVPTEGLPALTDAIYNVVTARAADHLRRLIPSVFGAGRAYYFETAPNVRFHIPFDETRKHAALFDTFAEKRGEGKLNAHGPHRDSWLDCPDNGVNIWIAIGRVRRGNGLTIYRDQYEGEHRFTRRGDIAEGERLTEPMTFDLAPGDFVLFHTDQVHGSELNRTDETRFVISFRITFDKPRFPRGHYHSYRSSRLAQGPLKDLAFAPALMQPSYARSLAERVARRLFPRPAEAPDQPPASPTAEGDLTADLAIGEIRPADAATCVARLNETDYVAFSRRCPHKGADLSNGFVADGKVVCPWHNLPFDPATGASPCTSLRGLAIRPAKVVDGRIELGARRGRTSGAKAPAPAED